MPKKRSQPDTRLIYADSESCADLLYLTGFFAPDPFPLLITPERSVMAISRLEISRAKATARVDEIVEWESLRAKWKQELAKGRDAMPKPADLIEILLRNLGVHSVLVPSDFPFGIASALANNGINVVAVDGAFVPERETKSEAEAAEVKRANKAAAAGLRAAERALKAAVIQPNGRLRLNGKLLTSEILRMIVDVACLENGAVAANTICACGDQACDPHERGSGPLRANELIIVDVFPRLARSGYHGDMTRTFLKGRASEAQRRLVETVRLAQFAAKESVKVGVHCSTVHKAADSVIVDNGFATEQVNGTWRGFFHSTGHGLGLEVHEMPRIAPSISVRLRPGMVFTVEPGLYYPGLGGCRIEDVVNVVEHGYEPLSQFHYRWEIR